MNTLPGRLLALALACTAVPVQAGVFTAQLSGDREAIPNDSPALGSAIATLDEVAGTLRLQSIFAGLTSPSTVAHVHCCTSDPGEGVAPPATTVPTLPGFPIGVLTGTYDETFDLMDPATYNPAFVTAHGGGVTGAMNALVAGLGTGVAYFNIHSEAFPAGEISGFLTSADVAPIPLPAAAWMFAPALAGLLGLRRGREADA